MTKERWAWLRATLSVRSAPDLPPAERSPEPAPAAEPSPDRPPPDEKPPAG
ncbi:MAG: hypothetical protein JNJ80_13235 [Gemmatimonadetes bacterium]|nr:hypothetical protein [Gemmatimonadota bacterium]